MNRRRSIVTFPLASSGLRQLRTTSRCVPPSLRRSTGRLHSIPAVASALVIRSNRVLKRVLSLGQLRSSGTLWRYASSLNFSSSICPAKPPAAFDCINNNTSPAWRLGRVGEYRVGDMSLGGGTIEKVPPYPSPPRAAHRRAKRRRSANGYGREGKRNPARATRVNVCYFAATTIETPTPSASAE